MAYDPFNAGYNDTRVQSNGEGLSWREIKKAWKTDKIVRRYGYATGGLIAAMFTVMATMEPPRLGTPSYEREIKLLPWQEQRASEEITAIGTAIVVPMVVIGSPFAAGKKPGSFAPR